MVDKNRSCKRKVTHATMQKAQIAQADFQRTRNKTLDIYKCRHCTGWHLGNPKR